MLAIGFDPSFIDTLVRAEDSQGNLTKKLPKPGNHHRRSVVSRIAGGNGVNVARTLIQLGTELILVVPTNEIFNQLLAQDGMKCDVSIHQQINETVALQWKKGEIQFNHVTATISARHFTKEIYTAWRSSPIQVSLNWGLNPDSPAWLSCLWLASCGWEFDRIKSLEPEELIQTAISEKNLQSRLVIEPGSIQDHPESSSLHRLLLTMSQSNYHKIFPIISCNEEEKDEFKPHIFPTKIVHTSSQVRMYQENSTLTYSVPRLDNVGTFVGAGDAFLGAIIHQLNETGEVDPDFAIAVAQDYMMDQ